MIETSENISVVSMERERSVDSAKTEYKEQPPVAPIVMHENDYVHEVTPIYSTTTQQGTQVAPAMPVSETDPATAFRHARLVITAGLVLMLAVVWIIQKRNSVK